MSMDRALALALGDYVDARYHPFGGIDAELKAIFEGRIEMEATDQYARLNAENLSAYRLFISYTEFAKEKPLPAGQVAALLSYVACGGGLLAIHNGISLQKSDELASMLGAKFTGHPPYAALQVRVREPAHPIMQGIGDFVIDDEPYRFAFHPFQRTTVLAEYEHEGERWPAAWAHEYGLGRVVYLMPGHRRSAFQTEMYRKLILNGGLWAARME